MIDPCYITLETHQKVSQELFIQSMPIKRRFQVFWDQVQVAGNFLQAAGVESAEMLLERLSGVDVGHIGQRKVLEIGKLGEGRLLQRGDLLVVHLGHVMIAEAVAGLVVDLETRIKLEHLQKLKKEIEIEFPFKFWIGLGLYLRLR